MSARTAIATTITLLLGGLACAADAPGGQAASTALEPAGPAAPGSGPADAAGMPDLFSGMWMSYSGFVEGDAGLNVPFTAKAQKYVAAYKHKRDIPYAEDGCRSPGLPISMRTGRIKFAYSPGLISIYMQSVGHTRFIRMNQKQGITTPRYYGNSIGHWEGDTLVVESVDFLPEITFQYGVGKPLPPLKTIGTANLGPPPGARPPGAPPGGGPPGGPPGGGPPPSLLSLSAAIWGPHGEGMHMLEKMRLVDAQTLEVQTTIFDDTVWTQPYVTATRSYRRSLAGEPEEWVCTVSITSFDPETNDYKDKDPEEMVKYLDKLGK
jgi:hypothetical protein